MRTQALMRKLKATLDRSFVSIPFAWTIADTQIFSNSVNGKVTINVSFIFCVLLHMEMGLGAQCLICTIIYSFIHQTFVEHLAISQTLCYM